MPATNTVSFLFAALRILGGGCGGGQQGKRASRLRFRLQKRRELQRAYYKITNSHYITYKLYTESQTRSFLYSCISAFSSRQNQTRCFCTSTRRRRLDFQGIFCVKIYTGIGSRSDVYFQVTCRIARLAPSIGRLSGATYQRTCRFLSSPFIGSRHGRRISALSAFHHRNSRKNI